MAQGSCFVDNTNLHDRVTDKRNDLLKWIDTAIEEALMKDGTYCGNRYFFTVYLSMEVNNFLELLDKLERSGR